jgi:hypothetical protein
MKTTRFLLFFGFILPMICSAQGSRTGCVSGNCINGKGTYQYANGAIYTGDFLNGARNGTGKYTFEHGAWYEGSFVNNAFEGYGVYLFSDGWKYAGYWKNNKYHGFGILYEPSGEISKEGTWENGEFISSRKAPSQSVSQTETGNLKQETYQESKGPGQSAVSELSEFRVGPNDCQILLLYAGGITNRFSGLYFPEKGYQVVGMTRYPVRYTLFGISEGKVHDWEGMRWLSFSSESGDLQSQMQALIPAIRGCMGNDWIQTTVRDRDPKILDQVNFIRGKEKIKLILTDYSYKKELNLSFRSDH